jgi:hypothetical protein
MYFFVANGKIPRREVSCQASICLSLEIDAEIMRAPESLEK